MKNDLESSLLLRMHSALMINYGDPHWWPGETPFEIAVGAILTQNTAWANVERAIRNLKDRHALDPLSLLEMSKPVLAELIRPAGYYNQKSRYLRSFSRAVMEEMGGEISTLSEMDPDEARGLLLGIKGVGKETADSILCYGASRPVLVVDAYTRRIMGRILGGDASESFREMSYDDLSSILMEEMAGDVGLYNRFHALIVLLGKHHCRKRPLCWGCPLSDFCSHPFWGK